MSRGQCVTDLRVTMRTTRTIKGAHCIVNVARRRLGDVEYMRLHGGRAWPALEASLKRELADLLAIANERGFKL